MKPGEFDTSSSDILTKIEKMLDNVDVIRANSRLMLVKNTDSKEVWNKLLSLKIDDLHLYHPKKNAKVPSHKSYLDRLMGMGRFDPEVYLMAAFIMKKFIELLSPQIVFGPYALKLFSMAILISHKVLMDMTWKLKDVSKILGYGKNSIQKMELQLHQILDFRIGFSSEDREEVLEWLIQVDELLEVLSEVNEIVDLNY